MLAVLLALALVVTMTDQARHERPAAAAPAAAGSTCPPVRPDETSARVTAKMCRGRVEVGSLASETRSVWVNPNGSMSMEVSALPKRARLADGTWAPINLGLQSLKDGGFRPVASAADVTFSAGGTGPLVTMNDGGHRLMLSWPGTLPAPRVVGDSATYAEVLPGVDLVLRAARTGFAAVVAVKTREAGANPALRSIDLRVDGDVRLARAADGMLTAAAGGHDVATAPAPAMWDSSRPAAPLGGARSSEREPGNGAKIRSAEARVAADGHLVLSPDPAMLSAVDTAYPVYIAPTFSNRMATWAYANSTNTTWPADRPRLGRNPADGTEFRPFFSFDLSPLRGRQVSDAKMSVKLVPAASCGPTSIQLYGTGAVPTVAGGRVAWDRYPLPVAGAPVASAQVGADGADACGPTRSDVDVVFASSALTADLSNSTVRRADSSTLALCACDAGGRVESDTSSLFYVEDPTVILGFNSPPTVGTRSTVPSTTCVTGTGRPFINTATPQLNAQIMDPDGLDVSAEFEWWAVGGSTKIGSTITGTAPEGSTFQATVPSGAFANGNDYSWRVRGNDGLVNGSWSSYCEFTVDTTAPSVAPGVSSTTYPEGSWSGSAGTPGTFTFAAGGVSDVAAYLYGLDANPPTTAVAASSLGGSAAVTITPPTSGPHTLYAVSMDRAGNASPLRSYQFYVGTGAVLLPRTGDMSAAKFALQALGQPGATGVTYQWRRGDADSWTTIPAANVTVAAGGGSVTWPQPTSGGGAFAKLNWDAAATLNDAEPGPDALSGPLQVRATFAGAGTSSDPVKVILDLDRAWASAPSVGPGSVNLLTGNLTVSQTDASVFNIGLSRTFNTRQAGGVDAMYGPGWVSSVAVKADPGYTDLTVTGSLVQIGLPDGAVLGFAKQSGTATTAVYAPQVGAEQFKLTWTSSPDRFTLTDPAGNVVLFDRPAGGSAGLYMPTSVTPNGSVETSTVAWELVPGSTTVARPTRVLAPVPTGVSCASALVAGCRALTFTYASTTTATGTAPSGWGDYTNRLVMVQFTGWDPDASPPGMRTIEVARFLYDSTGRLRASWNPGLDWFDTSVSPPVARQLKTVYAYDGNGILTSLTPPGEEAWSFAYTTVPGDSGLGRLATVSRSALSAGTAVATVVYRVPVSGTGAPYDLSGGQTARWGQSEPPTDAAAVFPPTQIPTGNQATGTMPSSYQRATVTYLDVNGRTVNNAGAGGGIDTTWYDAYGNTVRSLTAGNRKRSLEFSTSDTATAEAQLAEAASTVNTYSADGQRLLDTLGPAHDVVLASGPLIKGRTHTVYTYDEGAPAGGPYNLVTTAVNSVRYTGSGGVPVDADARRSTTAYDWALRAPTVQTTDPAGLALTARTTYYSDGYSNGKVNQTTTPEGGTATNTPSTRRTVYYRNGTGSGFSECDNHPEWAGLACRKDPGGQAATGPQIPAEVVTYDTFGQPRTRVEKTTAGVLRTIAIAHDSAGRPTVLTITAAAGLGTAVPKMKTMYDPASGQPVRTQSLDSSDAVTAQIIRAYDTLGRLTSYTDADNNTATTTYDIASRVATQSDGKATRTFTYEGGTEQRGLPTQVWDNGVGTFTAAYDVDGNVTYQSWPGDITVATEFDPTGAPTAITYTQYDCQFDCVPYTLYQEGVRYNAHGQWVMRDSFISTQVYGYDAAGRLTSVQDHAPDCTTRVYDFAGTSGKASNRTSLTTYSPDPFSGLCQTTSASSSRAYAYDAADRLTTSGTVYDSLGRTLTAPAVDTMAPANGDTTTTYHGNDMVRTVSQNGRTTTYTLDVLLNRVRSWTDNGSGATVTKTHHYLTDKDKPVWTDEGNGTWTRPIAGLRGLAAIQQGPISGNVMMQMINLHGDVVGGVTLGTLGLAYTSEQTEYGQPRSSSDIGTRRYGWLGAEQRAADTPGGSMLMGARSYGPATGRFQSTDPIYGGSANPYDYGGGDPVGRADPSGTFSCWIFNVSTRYWYYWWGTPGGIRYDFDVGCYFTDYEIFIMMIYGWLYGFVATIAFAFGLIPLGIAYAILALAVEILVAHYWWFCSAQKGAVIVIHVRWYKRFGQPYDWGWGWPWYRYWYCIW
jgi:RHS repeat-associated protein